MPRFPKQIETPRLTLVVPRKADAREINAAVLESYRELHPWMPWARRKPTLVQTGAFCRKAAGDFAARREFSFLIRLKKSGGLVGSAGLMRGNRSVPMFEVGYWLRTQFAGHGYATEAVLALEKFARKWLRVRRLEIRTDARNTRSAAVALRAGFMQEALLQQEARDNRGRLRDTRLLVKLF